ncbi:hypothetical protein GYA19_02475 [Candidatus Beckwithbacteria bacterium]|nr:hypothetical protein [Candidatus Beckwithbacteria bacterium]
MKIINLIKKHYFLPTLLIFSFVAKFITVFPNTFSFNFDQGKDSLAILHMLKTFSLKFIGPWTSISGLYFGPAWYYLLAPGYLLTNGNPLSAVVTMIILNLITIYLAYKYFGKITAVFFATTPLWAIISTSAWNPFPMPLLMLIILINLRNEKLKSKNIAMIMLSASLSFHFSSAYAFFYLLIIPLIIIYRILRFKQKIDLKFISAGIIAFIIPFIPQLLFEVKNHFVETKAIINYLQHPPENQFIIPFSQVVKSGLSEMTLAFLPEAINFLVLNKILHLLSFLFLAIAIYYVIKNKKEKFNWEYLLFIIIPLIGFSKLHFNIWYVYAMAPIFVIFVGKLVKNLPKFMQIIFILMLFITPVFQVYHYFNFAKNDIQHGRQALPIKEKAITKIRQLSQGKAFASYHYVPDIYDFSYNYLYLWQAFNGQKLPTEFAYEPGKIDYIPEKLELLAALKQTNQKPEYIFYIVESPENPDFLRDWWNHQNYKEIIYEEKLSETVMLYQALPK